MIKQHNIVASVVAETRSDDDDDELAHEPGIEPHFSRLRDYFKEDSNGIDNRFVQVVDADGTEKLVLKSSLVWILSETKGILSNDRLKRVQYHDGKSIKRKQKTESDLPSKRLAKRNETGICQKNEIQIGDWCFFENQIPDSNTNQTNLILNKSIIFGGVLGFRYATGKNEKEKSYSLNYCQINMPSEQNQIARGVDVLATWYKYIDDETLEPFTINSNFFSNINNYIATGNAPNVKKNSENNEVVYELKEFKKIKETLDSLCNISGNDSQ